KDVDENEKVVIFKEFEKVFEEIKNLCAFKKISLVQYIDEIEGKDVNSYMEEIYKTMCASVENGLKNTGVLPGKLQVKRKASYIFKQKTQEQNEVDLLRKRVLAYAYAVAEENASGGTIVTAPTCGAAGVLPACLYYALELKKYTHQEIIDALKVAGLIGNIVKTNGSISGAEAGCQAEVGTACAMSAAFLTYLDYKDAKMVERASEIALEHHLGLTCDPIDGYVQIPCIERNAVAALRAIDAQKLASYINSSDSKISFDLIVETMLATGHDLQASYRETSEGGLAQKYH
ncbi:MAG: L-serine ammonia-lyase, iron-sulfur-dependent, subunit alpha, partial [Anaeroplasmataceae bacterium]|nr:L-serine ammonia-lyase, iron-sulfur-dependent, subunit alpha [Anaeroplasmataceae bacterium]